MEWNRQDKRNEEGKIMKLIKKIVVWSCLAFIFLLFVVIQEETYEENLSEDEKLKYHYWKLDINKKLGYRSGIASSLNNIGNTYFKLEEHQKALDYLNQALILQRKLGYSSSVAASLNNIGNIYFSLSQYKKALDYYNRSLVIEKKLNDPSGIAASLNNIGNIYFSLSEYKKALDYYKRSLALRKKLDNVSDIAASLNNIGNVYKSLSDYEKALDYHSQSLHMKKKLNNPSGVANSLGNIGNIYKSLSDYEKALDYYNQSLTIDKQIHNNLGIAKSLNHIGSIYLNLSDYEKALTYYNQSFTINKKIRNQSGIADSLNNIGNIYYSLNEYNQALSYHNQSLAINKEIGGRLNIAASLNNVGNIYESLSEYEKALDYHNQSLAIDKEIGNLPGIASSLNNIGALHKSLKKYEKAQSYFRQSLAIEKKLGNRSGIAYSLNNIGIIHESLNEYAKALDYHDKALTLNKKLSNSLGIVNSLFSRAKCHRILENPKQAFDDYTKALEKWYKISEVAKISRKSFLKNKVFYFQEIIDFTILAKKEKKAWQNFQKYKGYGFLSLIAESKANLEKTVDPKLKRKRNLILAQISDIQKKLSERTKGKEIVDSLHSNLKEKEDELEEIIGEIRRGNPGFANLVYPETPTLKQVQSDLEDGEILLEYFFTTKNKFRSGKAYCFAVDKNCFEIIELGDSKEVNRKVKNFLHTLRDSKNSSITWTYTKEATVLYQLLLDPVLKNRNASKLIIAPDEMLHRLPFSALCLPMEEGKTWQDLSYVVDKYEICYVTSATAMVEMSKQKKANEKEFSLLAMADPVSENQRSAMRQNLSNLPGARQEVLAIAKNILPEKSLPKKISGNFTYEDKNISISFGKEAQEAKLFSLSLPYNILHFTTHGVIDPENSLRSFLLLAPTNIDKFSIKKSNLPLESISDGNLQAREIFHLKDKIQAQLVVLSACETGLGKLERGDGVVGFARAWMYAGVNNLVVSLWKVDDASTSRLMESFYQNLFEGKNSRDFLEYLSRAKKQLRYSEDYAAPYYWAPFVFIGK